MLQKCLTTTDDRAKRLLAQKSILAHILVKTVDEFKGMNWKDVVSYIESEPYISIVPIEPGLTNIENIDSKGQKIIGLNTENSEINEGLVRFDIIFYVRMRDGLSQIIINIEAQKDNPSAYHVLNRAIFYVCRLVSSQKERDFVNTNYDDIKRVVSIWICMNMKENTLNCFKLEDQALLGNYKWEGKLDMLNIVLIGLSKELPEYDEQSELHRLLCVLLSNKITPNDKMDIIEKEYNIPMEDNFRKEVVAMCNLSQGIVDETTEKIILNMNENNFTIEQIALATKKTVEEVEEIIKKNEPVIA